MYIEVKAIVESLVPRASLTHLDEAAESSAGLIMCVFSKRWRNTSKIVVAVYRCALRNGSFLFQMSFLCVPAIGIPQLCQECAVDCRRKITTCNPILRTFPTQNPRKSTLINPCLFLNRNLILKQRDRRDSVNQLLSRLLCNLALVLRDYIFHLSFISIASRKLTLL